MNDLTVEWVPLQQRKDCNLNNSSDHIKAVSSDFPEMFIGTVYTILR